MTRKRHTEEQIIAVLKDAQAGIGVQELCRTHGISDATLSPLYPSLSRSLIPLSMRKRPGVSG